MEQGSVYYPEEGCPQGGVVSPLLSNIYLHEVLDKWFEVTIVPKLQGRAKRIINIRNTTIYLLAIGFLRLQ